MNPKASVLVAGLAAALLSSPAGLSQQTPARANPENCPAEGFTGGFTRGCPQREFANPADISALMAALPDKPYATPKSLRRVLVLGRAVGWVHTSIPLAAKMVEYLGDRTGAWMTTITYDAAAITPENLKQYDAVFLSSTTGEFLDDPNDKAVTELRKQRSSGLREKRKRAGRHPRCHRQLPYDRAPGLPRRRSDSGHRHVARVQRDDRWLLQVPLGLPDTYPRQD